MDEQPSSPKIGIKRYRYGTYFFIFAVISALTRAVMEQANAGEYGLVLGLVFGSIGQVFIDLAVVYFFTLWIADLIRLRRKQPEENKKVKRSINIVFIVLALMDIYFIAIPWISPQKPQPVTTDVASFEQLTERVNSAYGILEEVYPVPVEKTLESLKQETNPEKAVEALEVAAEVYKSYTTDYPLLSLEEKKELFIILIIGSDALKQPEIFKHFDKKTIAELVENLNQAHTTRSR